MGQRAPAGLPDPGTRSGHPDIRRWDSAAVDERLREFLTAREVGRLREAAGDHLGRHGHHNATPILLACRHGL